MEYTETEYVEKNYDFTLDMANWLKEKFTLGLDFPNLPYFIDEDVKLTLVHVILKYIGRRHGMVGKTDEEMAKVELLTSEAMDLHSTFRSFVYKTDFVSCQI